MIYDKHNQRVKTKNKKNKNMTAEESFPRLKRIMTHTGKFELQKL